MSSILTIEDAVEFEGKMERLEQVYKDGVRMIALTWNFENSVGFPNSRDPEKHLKLGLKPFGIEVVQRMNELGMIVDVSFFQKPVSTISSNIPRSLSLPATAAAGLSGTTQET